MVGERPAGIPESAHTLWDTGVEGTQIHAGDLWILSWDGEVVGLPAIAAAKTGTCSRGPSLSPVRRRSGDRRLTPRW